MTKIIFILSCLYTSWSLAKATSYVCTVDSNPSRTALVAGEYFKMSTDDNFGINVNYSYPVKIESSYLGTCDGIGSENNHPLAEGYNGTISIGGSKCAADGFDIFVSPGIGSLIQVDTGDEAVFYSCVKIKN